MSYWKRLSTTPNSSLDNLGYSSTAAIQSVGEFHQWEPSVVLDIILDKNHEYFKGVGDGTKLDVEKWPADLKGNKPSDGDSDYTWMGRALVRPLFSMRAVDKEELIWAIPLDSNISEYPLINEIVLVIKILEKYYYTKKVNTFNVLNNNIDYNIETNNGGYDTGLGGSVKGNRELLFGAGGIPKDFQGPKSETKYQGGNGYEGVVGRYFWINDRIRHLKRYEGDTIIESRFGSSIRFGCYDKTRENDKGSKKNDDYYKEIDNPYTKVKTGGGNPMILIRNRQRPLTEAGSTKKIYDKLDPVIGTEEEKNVGGYIEEDLQNDGSSIHITSGATVSKFKPNTYKSLWGKDSEEQTGFDGITKFKWPNPLDGDQMILHSDRIILSARNEEIFQFSKKRYSVVTDDEYTVDSHNQMIFTTNNKIVLNSPAIYLGQYNETNEPVLLGQTTVDWLYTLCNWLLRHTHWYKHVHEDPDAGDAVLDKTQVPVQDRELILMRDNLNTLLSRRVFVVGGGFAPGKNGVQLNG
jgi:hypothetical protein